MSRILSRKTLLSARGFAALLMLAWVAFLGSPPALARSKKPPTLRWARGAPGSTFTRSDDGNYYYSLTTVDYEVVVRIDSQELAKVHRHGMEPFFSVLLDVRYRGRGVLPVDPSTATLEFVRHHKVIQKAIDPDSFSLRIQEDVEQVEFETEREVKKHPERKEDRERFLQTYKKETADLQDFISRHTLSQVELDPANSEALGWILFSTRNKWIGTWKNPEAFIFRLPLDKMMLEFPFALPPEQDDRSPSCPFVSFVVFLAYSAMQPTLQRGNLQNSETLKP